MSESAETLLARYYEQSASAYDDMHNASDDHEHNLALQYALQYMDMIVLLSAFKETPGKLNPSTH